jgi:cytoskeletal protein CcmA (bactofilin family)
LFKQKDRRDLPSLTSTVIGEGIRLEGAIISGAGSVRIDGSVSANVSVDGDIVIGETGSVNGNVEVLNALFAGRVEGNVTSRNSVHLTSTANIKGNITAASLVIDEGAIFSGSCSMSGAKFSEAPLVYESRNIFSDSELGNPDPNLSFDKN